jgi:hypothetical protein
VIRYPFVPKTNAHLAAGQFWSIPLSDGRFACGRVLRVDREVKTYGARAMFVGALLDWVGTEPPTSDAIAGRSVLQVCRAYVRTISEPGGAVLGERPLELDGIIVPADASTIWGFRGALFAAERRFVAGDPPPRAERREVRSPLTEEMLRPAVTGLGVVQFTSPLTDDDFGRLANWLSSYPEMTLRAYFRHRDVEFLRFFPFLRRFDVDATHDLESLDGLRYLPDDLEELAVGATRRRLDLAGLERFRGLKSLFLEGQSKRIDAISSLTSLENLSLRSITLPDLSLLLPLARLQTLEIKLGGTGDLRPLPLIGELRYLELWRIRGLSDVSAIGEMAHLQNLFLQALKHVESLPDLSGATALRRVRLQTMRGIRDLRPLASAPALEELILDDMPQLQPNDLAPLIGLPRLRAVSARIGIKKSAAVREILGLPEVSGPFDWRESSAGSTAGRAL